MRSGLRAASIQAGRTQRTHRSRSRTGTRIEVETDPLASRTGERVIVDGEDDAGAGVRRHPEDAGAQPGEVVHVDDVGARSEHAARKRVSAAAKSRPLEKARSARGGESVNRGRVPGETQGFRAPPREDRDVVPPALGLGERQDVPLGPAEGLGRELVDDVEDPQAQIPLRMRRSNHSNRPSRFQRTDFAPRYCARFWVNA